MVAAVAFAGSDERTISFYHIHTKETLTVTYKRNGEFVPEAMKKIDWLMRDWRRNESTKTDPDTIDLIWEMHRELGSKEPVHVICGYRSRGTNDMLRRTVGGQASNSQHITGKAIDIAFPDIPARQLRYSAMIRERGGVGYYPTSAIAFVHVDTARVRHWPNMSRNELALLFPSGKTKHRPSDGGSLRESDVAKARKAAPDTARQVAAYFDLRDRAKAPVLVADAGGAAADAATSTKPPQPKPAARPETPKEQQVALATPPPLPQQKPREPQPKLVAAPQLVERPSRFTPYPSKEDRNKLDKLVSLASLEAETNPPKLLRPPAPAVAPASPSSPSPEARSAPAAPIPPPAMAALAPKLDWSAAESRDDATPAEKEQKESWAQAPEFDEDHPEELFYRPFPLAPILTASANADDGVLSDMVHPDVAKTVELLDDTGSVLPMRFRPGQQAAELMWSKEFRGQAVSIAELIEDEREAPRVAKGPQLVAERMVKTSAP